MTVLGTVAACYRYPVKSMQGTTEATLTVTSTGVGGDRSWGLLDLATDRLASAKRFSALLAATGGDGVVTLPGGTEVDLTDPGADAVRPAEGHTHGCAIASARATRRGRRPWHARTLLEREPGDLQSDRRRPSWPAARIGKVRSRSR